MGFRMCALIVLALTACSTVPPEAVELSYKVGTDMEALHASYRKLIRAHFDKIRGEWNNYVDYKWRPVFLKKFIETGKLVENAKKADTEEGFLWVKNWAAIAEKRIRRYREAVLEPVNDQEAALTQSVDEAFMRVARANAVITAHLTSIRKVQEFQDRILEEMNLKDLRDDINDGIAKASAMTQKGIEITEEAGEKLKKAEDLKKEIEDFVKETKNA